MAPSLLQGCTMCVLYQITYMYAIRMYSVRPKSYILVVILPHIVKTMKPHIIKHLRAW